MKWFWSKKKKTEDAKLNNEATVLKQREEQLKAIKKAEAKEEIKYKVRHALYDTSKTIVGLFRKVFGKKIKKEDEIRRAGDRDLVTREEIFLGGTKPMSQYIASDGTKWLAKQAVNCMGYYKISGVLLTVAGANVQKLVDPHTAIDAYMGKTKEDGVISLQQRVENTVSSKAFDLFKFSKHPDLAPDNDLAIVEDLGDQILREHVTDWLLCNFDTKGENFLIRVGNKGFELVGIDKEAAFSKINDPNAQHMSSTYQPHANNTLYNAVFEKYKQGKLNLNLDVMQKKISELVNMDPDEYMNSFKDHLEYERRKNPATYAETYMKIRERKQSLGEEYNKFFTELINERIKAKPEEAEALKERYFKGGDKCTIFEPKDRSPKMQAMDTITRLREDAFARIANGNITVQSVAPFIVALGLKTKLENGGFDRAGAERIQEAFSAKSIKEKCSESALDPKVENIVNALKSGSVDLSNVKDAAEFGKAVLPFFKADRMSVHQQTTRFRLEDAEVAPRERKTVDLMTGGL